jgi:hypothetical protein
VGLARADAGRFAAVHGRWITFVNIINHLLASPLGTPFCILFTLATLTKVGSIEA